MLILGFLICPQIEDETQVSRATQGEQDNYEMHVRAANIVSGRGGKHPCRGHGWSSEQWGGADHILGDCPQWAWGGDRGQIDDLVHLV